MANDSLEKLILDLKDSLEREIGEVRRELRELHDDFQGFNARFENQSTRLDRHAALWQTGRRWSGRMDKWAERIDAALETKDIEIAELRKRIEKLESDNQSAA